MIDYETYCKIQDHRTRQGLTITQTAQALGLHPQTVSKWGSSAEFVGEIVGLNAVQSWHTDVPRSASGRRACGKDVDCGVGGPVSADS